jgi:flagellar biosynthetic protein FliO
MDFVQQAIGVLIVLGMLGAFAAFAKQRGFARLSLSPGAGSRIKRMKVVERLPLTAHHSLHLVEVDNRKILVAVSPGGCQLLANDPGEPQS